MKDFEKKIPQKKPFLQGFVTVFEKKYKIPGCCSKEEKKRPFLQ